MKLRTTHNSIRLRIRKSELVQLEQTHLIEEAIGFPAGPTLRFALVIRAQEQLLDAKFENHQIRISIAKSAAKQWIETNQVGIEAQLALPNSEELYLLIEKDFPCLDRENEDKSDTFWELATKAPETC